jgi:oligo-1,6-glucosidase
VVSTTLAPSSHRCSTTSKRDARSFVASLLDHLARSWSSSERQRASSRPRKPRLEPESSGCPPDGGLDDARSFVASLLDHLAKRRSLLRRIAARPPRFGRVERDWWKSAVVYQIYPRSFADSDGDGVGDLGGILRRFDHLVRLGVDVVWLSPVYRSPMDDNGYDISDYQDVDPLFGTLEQLDELIATAHHAGIKVVMDLVVNHTSDEHPWFVESRESTDNPKRDWYWWRPPRPGVEPGTAGAEPTNWGSAFSGPAWTYDGATGEYYLHLFSPKQPDLNWENAEVRAAVHRMMNWWLDRGVDGFRMDVINLISKVTVDGVPGLPEGSIGGRDPRGAGVIDTSEWGDTHPHVVNGPRLHDYLQEMHREVFAHRPPGLLTVGETPGASVEDGRLFTDAGRGELDMVFTFEHVDLDSGPGGKWDVVPLSLVALKDTLGRWQAGLADVGWNSLYWGNHDQPRAVSRFGSDAPEHRVASAMALATVLHLHRGTPDVYQGDELGMTNAPFETIDDFRDLESLNRFAAATARGEDPESVLAALRYKGRDNARTPMQWDAGEHAGFTTGEPWIAVNPNHQEINAAAQVDDPDSVFTHHRRLIALRHEDPVVAHGDFRMLLPEDDRLYAFTRTCDGTSLLVVANLSNEPADGGGLPDAEAWLAAETVLDSGPGDPASWVLPPWAARVRRRTATDPTE